MFVLGNEAKEIWSYRKMMRITWKGHVSNGLVLRIIETKRALRLSIRKRRQKFLEHVKGHRGLETLPLTGYFHHDLEENLVKRQMLLKTTMNRKLRRAISANS